LGVVRVLVAGGADIHARNNHNRSCVDVASFEENDDVVEFLNSAEAIGLSIQHKIWRQRRLWSLIGFHRRGPMLVLIRDLDNMS